MRLGPKRDEEEQGIRARDPGHDVNAKWKTVSTDGHIQDTSRSRLRGREYGIAIARNINGRQIVDLCLEHCEG